MYTDSSTKVSRFIMFIADVIVRCLEERGIDTFFVLTGGAIAPLVDAVGRSTTSQYYCFQHEQAASMAAEGYFRACGRVACVLVTSGPGVQNILNGVCGCYYDSIPALFISGQVNRKESLMNLTCKPRQAGFQEMPIDTLFSEFTKYCCTMDSCLNVHNQLDRAIQSMLQGRRGPSVLAIPVDIQMSPASNIPQTMSNMTIPSQPERLDRSTLERLVDMMSESHRPLCLVGQGCRESSTSLQEFLKEWRLPCSSSWAAMDFVSIADDAIGGGHFLGTHGVYGDRLANMCIQNADLMLVLGCRLDNRQTGGNVGIFSPESKKIMVDFDVNELDKFQDRGMHIDLKINTTMAAFFQSIQEFQAPTMDLSAWNQVIQDWKIFFEDSEAYKYEKKMSPYSIFQKVNHMLPEDAVVVTDTGATLAWCFQTIRPRYPSQKMFSNFANSSMGYGLCAAIGAAIALPSRPIYCVCGDGGLQQNIQELVTCHRYHLNIKVLVMNNGGYGIIKQFQNAYLGGRQTASNLTDIYGTSRIHFWRVAEAYGVCGYLVQSEDDLNILQSPGFSLLDFHIDENEEIVPKVVFGNSLENMSPFLDSIQDKMLTTPNSPKKPKGWVTLG